MARLKYLDKKFSTDSLVIIDQANAICAEYAAQGYDLTLRQLYYQFVSRDLIANRMSEYKRLGLIISEARLTGRLDWDYIVDRTRNLREVAHWDNPEAVITAAAESFAHDKWLSQDTRVEVWIEKDALVGVLEAICPAEDVSYFSCRGYTSQSELWGAAQRLRSYIWAGYNVVVLHLGDHDPSGVDMTRDIRDRLELFLRHDIPRKIRSERERYSDSPEMLPSELAMTTLGYMRRLKVDRIALTMEQVEQYNPPPNPAKLTDSRAGEYIENFGYDSWELDALEPTVLVNLIRDSIREYRDEDAWRDAVNAQEADREVLWGMVNAAALWPEVDELLTGEDDSIDEEPEED